MKQLKYKTKICKIKADFNGCPYGSKCLFAHSWRELMKQFGLEYDWEKVRKMDCMCSDKKIPMTFVQLVLDRNNIRCPMLMYQCPQCLVFGLCDFMYQFEMHTDRDYESLF
jgi:hypothetical protein